MSSLRILHIVHRLYPPFFGGLSVYADRICQLHAKRGHKVEAWTSLEDDRPSVESREGYLVRRFKARFSPFDNPITISMLPQLLRYARTNFDLIVAHSHLMFTTNLAALKSWLSSSPLVVMSHGYEVHRGPFFDNILQAYLSTFGRIIVRRSNAIVAMTSREARRFVKLGVSRHRCVTVPSGVDSDLFQPSKSPANRKRIVWTGRFVPEKNLECLLEAVALLRNRVPNIELVLAGEGPQRPRLVAVARSLGLNAHVDFPGLLSQEAIVSLLQSAAIYALPSTAEALPFSLLEAMSSGIPLVISKGLGLEEIADSSAQFAEPGNPHEWSQILEKLLEDKQLRNRMAARARELAVTRYDWDKVASRLERLFVSVVEGKEPL